MAAKTPAPRQPMHPRGYGIFGVAREIDGRYLFGTEEEILNRNATGYVTAPPDAAPSFVQIRPGPTDRNANEPRPEQRSGPSKFGSPRRYA